MTSNCWCKIFLLTLIHNFLNCSCFTVGGPFCKEDGTCFIDETKKVCEKLRGFNIDDTWCILSDDFQVLGPICNQSTTNCTAAISFCQDEDIHGEIIGEGIWCVVKSTSNHWFWSTWFLTLVAYSLIIAIIYFYYTHEHYDREDTFTSETEERRNTGDTSTSETEIIDESPTGNTMTPTGDEEEIVREGGLEEPLLLSK